MEFPKPPVGGAMSEDVNLLDREAPAPFVDPDHMAIRVQPPLAQLLFHHDVRSFRDLAHAR